MVLVFINTTRNDPISFLVGKNQGQWLAQIEGQPGSFWCLVAGDVIQFLSSGRG